MGSKSLFYGLTLAVLLVPARMFAGGPPRLCLPIDGVTAQNAESATKLVSVKLGDKIWQEPGPFEGIRIETDGSQNYLAFAMAKDVSLGDVEAALDGSGFSLPRGKLRLFGHVILEIDAHGTPPEKLAVDLKGVKSAVVDKSETKENLAMVTLQMPYPSDRGESGRATKVGWQTFDWNNYGPESMKSASPVSAQMLPTYDAVQKILAKHGAALKDVRWSTSYSCRPVGCVVAATSVQ